MPQVIFNILDKENEQGAPPAHFVQACQLAAKHYQKKQRVVIYCASQEDAETIDELLFAFDPDQFVPHCISGEGPAANVPVEISTEPPRGIFPVLINLHPQAATFAVKSRLIVDFVPTDETLKQVARDRYRQYRKAGMTPETRNLPVD